jgi:hypothetical protein
MARSAVRCIPEVYSPKCLEDEFSEVHATLAKKVQKGRTALSNSSAIHRCLLGWVL